MIKAGKLRHRIGIYEPHRERDELGGFKESFTEIMRIWGDIEPKRSSKVVHNQRFRQETTHIITIRYIFKDLKSDLLLNYKDRVFDILGIINIDERSRKMEIEVKEIDPARVDLIEFVRFLAVVLEAEAESEAFISLDRILAGTSLDNSLGDGFIRVKQNIASETLENSTAGGIMGVDFAIVGHLEANTQAQAELIVEVIREDLQGLTEAISQATGTLRAFVEVESTIQASTEVKGRIDLEVKVNLETTLQATTEGSALLSSIYSLRTLIVAITEVQADYTRLRTISADLQENTDSTGFFRLDKSIDSSLEAHTEALSDYLRVRTTDVSLEESTQGTGDLEVIPAPVLDQFYTDFSEYTTAFGIPDGWSQRWEVGLTSDWQIREGLAGTTGDKVLQHLGDFNDWRFLSWDDRGIVEDAEIVSRWRSGAEGEHTFHIIRGSGTGVNRQGYFSWIQRYGDWGSFNIQRMLNGQSEWLGSVEILYEFDTWYWARFRVEGSNILYKVWLDSDPEPVEWMVTATDTNITSGYLGVGTHRGTQYKQWDILGVGLNGASAPTSPL